MLQARQTMWSAYNVYKRKVNKQQNEIPERGKRKEERMPIRLLHIEPLAYILILNRTTWIDTIYLLLLYTLPKMQLRRRHTSSTGSVTCHAHKG